MQIPGRLDMLPDHVIFLPRDDQNRLRFSRNWKSRRSQSSLKNDGHAQIRIHGERESKYRKQGGE